MHCRVNNLINILNGVRLIIIYKTKLNIFATVYCLI